MTEADGKPHASTGHARAITGAPPVEHPPARGTMPCAPGAFSLTAPVFRSPRAQKGARGGTGRTGRTGAERRKCGSGCRDRQESASWGRCGSGARLSDGNRKGREMVARDEQKRMAGRVAWRDDVGNGNEPSQRGTDGRRKGQAGDHRTANKRGASRSGAGRGLDEPEKRPTKY